MAKIPLAEDRVVFSGAQFQQSQQQDVTQPMVEALHQWGVRRREEYEAAAMERVTQAATRRQQEAGLDSVVTAPSRWARGYQEAFNKQAQAVFTADLSLDAARAVRALSQEHEGDPEAFAEAWNSYMVGQITPLEETDPTAAQQVREKMDALGLRTQFKMEDELAARAHRATQAAYLQDVNRQIAEIQDELLRNGDEEAFAGFIDEIDELVAAGVDGDLITPAQAASLATEARTRGAEELAHGLFNQAIEAGDVGGAQGVIDQARDGVWFENNPHGRSVADRLERELVSMLGAGEDARKESVVRSFRTLDALVARQQATGVGVLDDPAAEEAIEHVQLYGNENDLDRLERLLVASHLRQQLGDRLEFLNAGELADASAAVDSVAANMPAGAVSEIHKMLEDRAAALDDARQALDPLRAAGPMVLQEPPSSDSARASLMQQLEQRRAKAARALGVDRSAIGYWSDDDLKVLRDRFQDSLASEDLEGAIATQEQFFLPAQGDLGKAVAMAMDAKEPDFAAAMTMSAVAGPEAASQLWVLATQGRDADRAIREKADDLLENRSVQRRLRDMAESMSFGSPKVRDATYNMLADAYAGLVVELEPTRPQGGLFRSIWQSLPGTGSLRRDVARAFETMTEPMAEFHTFSNGAKVPKVLVDDNPNRARRIGEAIDRMMDDPTKLGYSPGDSLHTIHPLFTPEGEIYFRDSRRPRAVLRDPDSEQGDPRPLVVDPVELVPESPRREMGWAQRASEAWSRTVNSMRLKGYEQGTLRHVADATNGNQGVLSAVFMASRENAQTTNAMSLTPEALESLDTDRYERAWDTYRVHLENVVGQPTKRRAPNPVTNSEGAAVAASMLLDQFANKYGSVDQALAAYWLGEDVVDSMGDDWRALIGVEARQFIARVKNRFDNG